MLIDNTEFKKIFLKHLNKIIVPFLIEKGYKFMENSIKGIFWFEKSVRNIVFNIDFQIKSIYLHSFDFYYGNTGRDTKEFPIFKEHWEVHSENDIEQSLKKILDIIKGELLPWFKTVEMIDINYKEILINTVSEKLKQMNFHFKTELYCRKIAYLDARNMNDIEFLLLFPFLRNTQVGWDVIRFEYNEIKNFLELRFLFYPETSKSKFVFISSLADGIGLLRFKDDIGYNKIIMKFLKAIEEHADKWFEENRPKKRPNVENWGLFPDLDQHPKQKEKFVKLMASLPPLK